MADRHPVFGETDHSDEKTYSQTMTQASSVSSSSFSHQAGAAQELAIPGWSQQGQQKKEDLVDQTFDQLIAETEKTANNDDILFSQLQSAVVSQSFQSTQMTSTSFSSESIQQSFLTNMSQAEQCRRSFEEAELEAMRLENQSSRQISKQSSMIETASVQSFVYQEEPSNNFISPTKIDEEALQLQALPTKPLRSVSSHNIENAHSQQKNSEATFQSRQSLKSGSFIRTPETFTTAQ